MQGSDRKIYRSSSDYIIAGVCGGLAEYFNIDPTLVRIIFVLLALWGGGGFLIYLILWLVIPKNEVSGMSPDRSEKVKDFAKEVSSRAKDMANDVKVDLNKNGKDGRYIFGIALVLLGGLALWNQLVPMTIRWEFLWPVAAILFGVYIIFKR